MYIYNKEKERKREKGGYIVRKESKKAKIY